MIREIDIWRDANLMMKRWSLYGTDEIENASAFRGLAAIAIATGWWLKIDGEDAAVFALPPTGPSRDAAGWYPPSSRTIAQNQLRNLSFVREKIGEYYEKGLGVRQDYREAAT